ncbi:hypothetical protein OAI24_02865, partial [Alphaproteobacteria bacterium]|nr:hypothetical protein [Alphaproteobacteria bacterium]
SPDEAEAIIMLSRVNVGWVTQEELDAQAAEKQAALLAEQAGDIEAEAAPEADASGEPADEAPAL